jgi:hypothetical protein
VSIMELNIITCTIRSGRVLESSNMHSFDTGLGIAVKNDRNSIFDLLFLTCQFF